MNTDSTAETLKHIKSVSDKSIEINKDRFGMSEQLIDIFKNTAKKH